VAAATSISRIGNEWLVAHSRLRESALHWTQPGVRPRAFAAH
jgi:hypothetical protein